MKAIKKFFKFILIDWWMFIIKKVLQFLGLFIGYGWLWGNNKAMRKMKKEIIEARAAKTSGKVKTKLMYCHVRLNIGSPKQAKKFVKEMGKYLAGDYKNDDELSKILCEYGNGWWYFYVPASLGDKVFDDLRKCSAFSACSETQMNPISSASVSTSRDRGKLFNMFYG